MTATEMIVNKMQEILGAQYAVCTNDAFNKDFTSSVPSPYGGHVLDVNWSAFDENADRIIAVVDTQPIQLYNTPYKLIQNSYTAKFWVPVDFIKRNALGQLLEPPKFNFYGDMERLKNALNGNAQLTDGDTPLKAYFTVSEPILANSALDITGAYKRAVMQISGSVSISDPEVGTGADIRISFDMGGSEVFIENTYEINLGATTEANAVLHQADEKLKQDVAQTQHALSFRVDDYVNDNTAMRLIEDKTFQNISTLSPGADTTGRRKKVFVRVYKRDALKVAFWGVLSASVRYQGRAGIGSYEVSIANDGGIGQDEGG